MHQLLPWMAGCKYDRFNENGIQKIVWITTFSTDFNLNKMDKMAIITSIKRLPVGIERLDFIARLEKSFQQV